MTSYLVGRLRCRWPSVLRAGRQAAISGGATSAALEITAVASCADQCGPSPRVSLASEPRPSRGLKHQGRSTFQEAGSIASQSASQSLVLKKAPTRLNRPPKAKSKFSVKTNLPNQLPILNDEIALVGPALAELLRTATAGNDNGGQD